MNRQDRGLLFCALVVAAAVVFAFSTDDAPTPSPCALRCESAAYLAIDGCVCLEPRNVK